jgi:hypothetical protein
VKQKYYAAGMAGLFLIKIVHRGTAREWFDGVSVLLVQAAFYLGIGLCAVQGLIWLHALMRRLLSRTHGPAST